MKMKLDGAMLSSLVAVIAVVTTVFGWIVVNDQNAERDLVNERREQRTRYLVDAYRNMAAAVNREKRSREETRRLEDAIMSIQLFGTKEQIEAISEVQQENGGSDWGPVLKALRNYLREELNMPPIEDDFRIWRWTEGHQSIRPASTRSST